MLQVIELLLFLLDAQHIPISGLRSWENARKKIQLLYSEEREHQVLSGDFRELLRFTKPSFPMHAQ